MQWNKENMLLIRIDHLQMNHMLALNIPWVIAMQLKRNISNKPILIRF